jgi:ankyrin repeat protein
MVWQKVGSNLTCMDTLTPGTVEFKFHGPSDLQKIRLRKFGYVGKNLDVRPTDDKISAELGAPAPDSFLATEDRKPELRQLNASLEKDFQNTIFADPEAFRCMPFELKYVHVMDDEGTTRLGVAITLDRSFGGPAFRLASHVGTRDERRQKTAQAALEGGVADLFVRLRRMAAKFPNIDSLTVLCYYPTTEAYLDFLQTAPQFHIHSTQYQTIGMGRDSMMHVTGTVTTTVQGWTRGVEYTVVKDRAVERIIKIAMSAAQIPDTMDKKAITEAVLAEGEIDLGDGKGNWPITPTAADKIRDAAADGDLAMVKTLLTDHPDLVFSKDERGDTPLHWAAGKNHKGVAELLLASKANVMAQDKAGWTPLHFAACKADKDLAELLLDKGADVNAKSQRSETPLELAALNGQKDIVELLLAKGADLNARDNVGNTPLHAAALGDSTRVAELLLAKGADINAKDNDSQTPLRRAADGGHKTMAEFLRQHGGHE